MEGATTNICYNLLDRNVYEKKLGDKIAFYWWVASFEIEIMQFVVVVFVQILLVLG